jgi:uncharacterized protein
MTSVDLFSAAYGNNTAAVEAAIASGADPNAQHPRAGTLPLQLACQGNAIQAIEVLLASGANADAVFTRVSAVDGRTFGSHTPLMYAETAAAAQLLLDAGAEINRHDDLGWTALVWAAHAGNRELVAFLLGRGARIDARPIYAGKEWGLLEFIDEQIRGISSQMGVLKQPASSERLADLQASRLALVEWMRT